MKYGPALLPPPEQVEALARMRARARRQQLAPLVVLFPTLQGLTAVLLGSVEGWPLALYALAALVLLAAVTVFRWGHLRAIIAQTVMVLPLTIGTCRFPVLWFFQVLALLCLAAIATLWLRSIDDLT